MCTIDVPVKKYVKKYLLSRYQVSNTWPLNKQERVGKMLYSLLERMPKRFDKNEPDLGDHLTVFICRDYYRNKGIYLSNESILDFNDFIHQEIVEQIAMYAHQVKSRVGLKKYPELYIKLSTTSRSRVHVVQNPKLDQFMEKREIIYDILRLYDITEDDLPFDTIKKSWQRLKLPMLIAS